MDASSIQLTLESIKATFDICRELSRLVRSGTAGEKIIEMNTKILDAQQYALSTQADQLTLSEKISDLEEELIRLKDFRSEKKNYQFEKIGDTAFVYTYKQPVDSGKPPHWICSTCCDQDRKSTLQFQGADIINFGMNVWKCHLCGSDIRVDVNQHP